MSQKNLIVSKHDLCTFTGSGGAELFKFGWLRDEAGNKSSLNLIVCYNPLRYSDALIVQILSIKQAAMFYHELLYNGWSVDVESTPPEFRLPEGTRFNGEKRELERIA